MLALKLILFASVIYLLVGTVTYLLGHPKLYRRVLSGVGDSHKRRHRKKLARRNAFHRHLAHSAQLVNFLLNKTLRRRRRPKFSGLQDTYRIAVRRAFDPKRQWFITTGSPHGRACYPRNFAWFYPTLLDPRTIIDITDLENRSTLMVRSLETILKAAGTAPLTTTLIPLTKNRMSAVNYVTPPSDSLLGILAGIEQLALCNSPTTAAEGARLLRDYVSDLHAQTDHLLRELKPFTFDGTTCPLIDVVQNRSTATDTRRGRLRFVVAANIWATIATALRLDIVEGKFVRDRLGFDLAEYKERILKLFGKGGYIRNSFDQELGETESSEITLDFVHVRRGFWSFSTQAEILLFKQTVQRIFSDREFADASGDTFFISKGRIYYRPLHRYTVPGYHGRTVWPSFNVAFAERLLEFEQCTQDASFRDRTERILRGVRNIVEKNGVYPELVDEEGALYKTWIYSGARADSWFPYFASVCCQAFGAMF
jgi:hypothetical protein